uniref:Abl-interactor homeo-domain homologous domain-containing protein n=1 Tax=Leptobrachium leishanense TaxID=445787 RepID=A0A8C5QQK2_9ANUR
MKQLGMEDESTARRSLQDHYISINTARQALSSSYQNLQNVADYCEKNYMEASDKQKALQDTMSLVTQTLASVASQIVVASGAVVCMLEEQNHILLQEDRKLCFISQLVDIHSEKVSRQKIGSLTTRRRFPPTEKILNVEKLQRQTSYTRHPLNFTSLDNVGNGIIDSDSQFTKTGTMSRRASSKSLTQKPGSLGRSSRANTPILTPLIPEGKFTPPPTPPVVNVPSPVSPVFSCSSSFPPPLSANDPYGVNQSGLADFPPPLDMNDFPPPMDYEMNVSPWFSSPIEEETMSSLQEFEDSLPPPPPPDYEMKNDLWKLSNSK